MGVQFVPESAGALGRLWAETTRDVVLETDRAGYIHGAAGVSPRGGGLFGAHLLDLIHPRSAAAAMAAHHAACGEWREVRMLGAGRARWSELRATPLPGKRIAVVLRSIDERRTLEARLFAASMTDALTGLTNRHAFMTMLGHLTDARAPGSLAILAIDRFKAINLRYGHGVGDELLVVVADLLRSLLRRDDIVSRIGGESFAVLLPGLTPDDAEAPCASVVTALAELGQAAGAAELPVTLSAGLVALDGGCEQVLRAAELAVTLAKAKGGNRLERDCGIASYPDFPRRLHR